MNIHAPTTTLKNRTSLIPSNPSTIINTFPYSFLSRCHFIVNISLLFLMVLPHILVSINSVFLLACFSLRYSLVCLWECVQLWRTQLCFSVAPHWGKMPHSSILLMVDVWVVSRSLLQPVLLWSFLLPSANSKISFFIFLSKILFHDKMLWELVIYKL